MFSGARPGVSIASRIAATATSSLPWSSARYDTRDKRREVGPDREHLVGRVGGLVVPAELDEGVDDHGPGRGEVRREPDGLRPVVSASLNCVLAELEAADPGEDQGVVRDEPASCVEGGLAPGRRATDRRSRGCAGAGRTRGRAATSRRRVGRRWPPRGPRCGRPSAMSAARTATAGAASAGRRRRRRRDPRRCDRGTAVDAGLGGGEHRPARRPRPTSTRARGRSRPRVRTIMPRIRAGDAGVR